MSRAILRGAAAALLALACDPGLTHRCTSTAQCVRSGEQGTCESTGFCSFADPNCSSGRRYTQWAGDLESQCVMGDAADGGAGDAAPADARPPDGAAADARPADARAPDATVDAAPPDAVVDAP